MNDNLKKKRILVFLTSLSIFLLSVFGSENIATGKCKWITGNIYPLPNRTYFYMLCRKIEKAQKSIDICMYLFKCNHRKRKSRSYILEKKLIRRAKQGVYIRVLLENSDYDPELNKINLAVGRKMKQYGIFVYIDHPKITTHSKLIIIDKKLVFLGSHNITNAALKYNNEFSVMIDSRDFARIAERYFENLLKVGKPIDFNYPTKSSARKK